eukprot:COSAG02_NODE_5090_length_4641_cov_4.838397_7_plen_109_part_00
MKKFALSTIQYTLQKGRLGVARNPATWYKVYSGLSKIVLVASRFKLGSGEAVWGVAFERRCAPGPHRARPAPARTRVSRNLTQGGERSRCPSRDGFATAGKSSQLALP